jgi:hypothetical protein
VCTHDTTVVTTVLWCGNGADLHVQRDVESMYPKLLQLHSQPQTMSTILPSLVGDPRVTQFGSSTHTAIEYGIGTIPVPIFHMMS